MQMDDKDYDVSIIRPEMRHDDVELRGIGFEPERLKKIKKALRTLHTLELMATNIYKFQLTKEPTELNRELTAAMCNEMTHYQDFQTKLFEYGFKPCMFRWMYWMVGFAFGFLSRMMGKKAILKTGIWVEAKACSHYKELLEEIDWDDDTRMIVEKDRADEFGHIDRWKSMLEKD